MARLKKGDITIAEILSLSYLYYKNIDNKAWRMTLDVNSAYIISRNNFQYDRSKRKWVQSGRDAKIVLNVISRPVSYERIDTVKIHKYPVTFLLKDITLGLNSPFKWRTGSLKKPIIAKKGKKYTSKERINIANTNIKRGIQLDFFYNLSAVLKGYDLLYGINWASGLPKKSKNKKHIPYFDKTAYFVVVKILIPLLNNSKVINKFS